MNPSATEPEAFAPVSPDNYLRLECEAVEKHEYYFGEVRAMAGASYAHNRVCARACSQERA